MPTQIVECARDLTSSPARVWSVVGDFAGDWHPVMASCALEISADGAQRRVFRDQDGAEYCERLTYYSASDRRYHYVLERGIDGAARYEASVTVASLGTGGSRVSWRAEITAPEPRLAAIAKGTRAVFEAGLDWLAGAELPDPEATRCDSGAGPDITRTMLDGTPALSILRGGVGQSETLVLCLHGIGGNATNWEPQLAALGGRFNIAALDLRGYGQSTLGFAATQVEDHCADILAVMQAMGAQRLVLVGLSMGSWIATSFAMRYPDLLDGLVLAGGCTGMSEAGFEERENFRLSRAAPLQEGQVPADFAASVVEVIAGPRASVEMRAALHVSMAAIPAQTYLDALNCFCNPLEKFDFARITCPVLMITGSHDKLAPPAEIRAVSHRIHAAMARPDVGFEILPGIGHLCNLEGAEAFNAHLAPFLERLAGVRQQSGGTRAARKRQKAQRILDAALAEFSGNGFGGASMEAIARRAEVSKPTLYQYFGDKEALFAAVLEQGRAHILTPLTRAQGPLVERLWSFAWTYAEFVLRPDMLSLARLILGEAERRPEAAAAYHKAGPGKAFAGLVAFVEASVDAGELQANDAELAAQDLWSLILSGPRDHHLHFVNDTPDKANLHRSISHGLGVFLRVYSCQPEADLAALAEKTR